MTGIAQRVIGDRSIEATFTITYRDGSIAHLPVAVKALEVYEAGALKQSFFASHGDIERTGPSTYRAYIDPLLYTPGVWLVARWVVTHPSTGMQGYIDLDVVMTETSSPAPTEGEYATETISDVATLSEGRHLTANEITRRFGLLLRRFNGTRVAFFLRNKGGKRCTMCWDPDFKRVTDSQCRFCWGEGFEGGYSQPILGWVFHNQPATQVNLNQLVERKKEVTPEWWTMPYPVLTPGDFFVKPNGERWRITAVPTNKMEGEDHSQVTRQLGIVTRVDTDDIIMQMPVPDLRRPDDIFVGFLSGVTKMDAVSGILFEASGAL